MGSSDLAREFGALEAGLDRELWVVTAAGARPGGLLATSVSMASVVPEMPRVLVAIGRRHATRALIERSGAFALHLFGESRFDWVERFALQSGHSADKLAGIDQAPGPTGSPILAGAAGWLDCKVEAQFETGDRTVYLGGVVAAKAPSGVPPLTFRRMLDLATPELRLRLREQRLRDGAADAVEIRRWRLSHHAEGAPR
jgi:flavin reductase (DIM6/NTAB) family NADH-FMN oxidoreductase RutF